MLTNLLIVLKLQLIENMGSTLTSLTSQVYNYDTDIFDCIKEDNLEKVKEWLKSSYRRSLDLISIGFQDTTMLFSDEKNRYFPEMFAVMNGKYEIAEYLASHLQSQTGKENPLFYQFIEFQKTKEHLQLLKCVIFELNEGLARTKENELTFEYFALLVCMDWHISFIKKCIPIHTYPKLLEDHKAVRKYFKLIEESLRNCSSEELHQFQETMRKIEEM